MITEKKKATMNRRSFLSLASGAALWATAGSLLPRSRASAAIDRTSKWAPGAAPFLAAEWRYVAGRIADSGQDYGFIVSMADIRVQGVYELLVERQEFTGSKAFTTKSYPGTLTYDAALATYTFRDAQNQTLGTWQWDEGAQVYKLSVTTPELMLQNVVLRPQGSLIPEGGDGVINTGQIAGTTVVSDYHADWTAVEDAGTIKGTARVDMQNVRLPTQVAGLYGNSGQTISLGDYDHHWFAIAGESQGAPVWISAWRLETQTSPFWNVTIARGSGASWQVSSFTEESPAAAPLTVEILEYQPIPDAAQSGASTGMAWHITAGVSLPGDLISLDVRVPPGQFATSAYKYTLGEQGVLEEGVGTTAAGTVQGAALTNVVLVVAESTAEFYLQYIPILYR